MVFLISFCLFYRTRILISIAQNCSLPSFLGKVFLSPEITLSSRYDDFDTWRANNHVLILLFEFLMRYMRWLKCFCGAKSIYRNSFWGVWDYSTFRYYRTGFRSKYRLNSLSVVFIFGLLTPLTWQQKCQNNGYGPLWTVIYSWTYKDNTI